VVGGVALSIAGTGVVSDTGVQALSVGADLGYLALLVRGATHGHAPHIRVPGISLWAVAYWLVVVDIALGIGAAVTRVDTVAVVACLGLGAVIIGLASDNNRFRLSTRNPGVSNISVGATTDRFMILNPAESICGTGVGNSAGIEALPVDTGGVRGAFRVISAFGCQAYFIVRNNLQALNPGVAGVPYGAGAT